MEPESILITASSSATFFYIIGGVLVALALIISFVGMSRDNFPSSGMLRGLLGLMALVVLFTATGAVLSARDEQEIRREENQEAAREAEAETEANVEAEAPEREGEAAEPDAGPDASAPGGEQIDAAQLFVDTGCGSCHTLADAGTDGQVGPSLDEVLPDLDPEAIRTSIVDPSADVAEGFPDGVMPSNYGDMLTQAQLDALVEYLADTAGQQ